MDLKKWLVGGLDSAEVGVFHWTVTQMPIVPGETKKQGESDWSFFWLVEFKGEPFPPQKKKEAPLGNWVKWLVEAVWLVGWIGKLGWVEALWLKLKLEWVG